MHIEVEICIYALNSHNQLKPRSRIQVILSDVDMTFLQRMFLESFLWIQTKTERPANVKC